MITENQPPLPLPPTPPEETGLTPQRLEKLCDEIYDEVDKIYISFCNDVFLNCQKLIKLITNNSLIISREQQKLAPIKDSLATPLHELYEKCPETYQKPQNMSIKFKIPQKVENKPLEIKIPKSENKMLRRNLYTTVNKIVAFDRKVEYIPYLGDEKVDQISQVLSNHTQKMNKRWEMRKLKSECIFYAFIILF